MAEGGVRPRRSRARRGDGAKLRQELLDAAARLLDTRGEDAVTVRAVVGEVGCTTPSLYLHFSTRDDLLEALCLDVWDELRRRMEGADTDIDDPFAALFAMSTQYVRFGLSHPLRYGLVMKGPAGGVRDQVAAACFRLIARAIERCADEGVLSGDIGAMTRAMCAALHGAVSLLIIQEPENWPSDTDAYAHDVATMACHGLKSVGRQGGR